MTKAEMLLRLQRMKERLERQREQITGRLSALREELVKKHKCNSIEEAERLLAKMREKQAKFESYLESQEQKFQTMYDEMVESMDGVFDDFGE